MVNLQNLELAPERLLYEAVQPGIGPPKSAFLVGGNGGFTNVRKLPQLLWEKAGVVVVEHFTRAAFGRSVHAELAIVLVDQCSHEMSGWARTIADQVVYAPATWSKVYTGLTRVLPGLTQGNMYRPPARHSSEAGSASPAAEAAPASIIRHVVGEETISMTKTAPNAEGARVPGIPMSVQDGMAWEGLDNAELVLWLADYCDYHEITHRELADRVGKSAGWVHRAVAVGRRANDELLAAMRPGALPGHGALISPRKAYSILTACKDNDSEIHAAISGVITRAKRALAIANKEASNNMPTTRQTAVAPPGALPPELTDLLKKVDGVMKKLRVETLTMRREDEGGLKVSVVQMRPVELNITL